MSNGRSGKTRTSAPMYLVALSRRMSETLSEGISTLMRRISPQGCWDLTPPTCHGLVLLCWMSCVMCMMRGGQSVSQSASPSTTTHKLTYIGPPTA